MNNLVKIDTATIQMFGNIARYMAQSGYFLGTGDNKPQNVEQMEAQAFVKMMAGHELGIGPVLSMQHIHVIDRKTSMDATLVAGQIKGSGKYDYVVQEMSNSICVIRFYEMKRGEWVQIGTSTWSIDDAKNAGLLDRPNWKKYRRDLLFSRCVTFGARRFCPDVFLGPIYTPEELGADIAPASLTEELPVTVRSLTTGDGATTDAAPALQLAAHTEEMSDEQKAWYDKVLNKMASRLQAVANAPEEVWNKAYDGALEYVAGWPTEHRDEAHTIAAGISEARRLAMEDEEERAAMMDNDTSHPGHPSNFGDN